MKKILEPVDTQKRRLTVLNQIAAVLTLEAKEDLRVFTERFNPWAEFAKVKEGEVVRPLVNVQHGQTVYDGRASNIAWQRATSTFILDCYGFGRSKDVHGGGHVPGDEEAALQAVRCAGIVENIIMSGHYAHLGMRRTVADRRITSIRRLDPPSEAQLTNRVLAEEVTLEVRFDESAPQVQGIPIEGISTQVRRAPNGEVFLDADFGSAAEG